MSLQASVQRFEPSVSENYPLSPLVGVIAQPEPPPTQAGSELIEMRFQPDITLDMYSDGIKDLTMDLTPEGLQGIWAFLLVNFSEPELHLQMSRPPPQLKIEWESNGSQFDFDSQTWISSLPDPSRYNILLTGLFRTLIIGFTTEDFLDGLATACYWFGLDIDQLIIWITDENGQSLPFESQSPDRHLPGFRG